MKTIRIFISSPGDVTEEREKARQVVRELQRRYLGRLELLPVLWEDLPLQADTSFQQGIELVLSQEHGIDIAVFILWSRLGSPLGKRVRKLDGTEYRSGTEREFDLMLQARQQSDGKRPAMLAYVRQDDRGFKDALKDKPTNELEEMIQQHKAAEAFIREQFHETEGGHNIRAYHTFTEPVSFAVRLHTHLAQLLDELLPEFALSSSQIRREGSPFRGLQAFEFEHADIFFGRDQAVEDVQLRLLEQAANGCAFVLIVGASGSGKSSLARAGVLPALVNQHPDPGVKEWRRAIFLPGQHAGDLCQGLARALLEALPELREDEGSLDKLAEALREKPKLAYDLRIEGLLKRLGGRLVLLVDQLEEVFTHGAIRSEDMDRLFTALGALARSGSIWVLATVRSDYYARCQACPVLLAMKGTHGQYDLLPPTPGELRRIITKPVWLAGLRYERNRAEIGLDERILDDAVKHAETLTLLEYLLNELYERRTPEGILTWQVYEDLGGVEGALGKRAEETFQGLPEEVQNALGEVLDGLVTVGEKDENAVARQRTPLETLTDTPGKRGLVEALLTARLLVADKDDRGQAVVHVAHEALLRRWERVARWAEDNREFLRVRARVVARMNEGSRLLEGDPLLEEARHHLANTRRGFTPEQASFIEDCVRAAQQAACRRERLRQRVIALLLVMLLLALGAAGWAWTSAKEAKTKEHQAAIAHARSSYARSNALIAADRMDVALAELASMIRRNVDSRLAAERVVALLSARDFCLPIAEHHYVVGLEECRIPDSFRSDLRRFRASGIVSPSGKWLIVPSKTNSAILEIQDLVSREHLVSLMEAEKGGFFKSACFSPSGQEILTTSGISVYNRGGFAVPFVRTARIWDARSGKAKMTLQPDVAISSAGFSPYGRWVQLSLPMEVQLWDTVTGEKGTGLRCPNVQSVVFPPENNRVLTLSWDGKLALWNTSPGAGTKIWEHSTETNCSCAFFSNDGNYAIATGPALAILDARSGKPAFSTPPTRPLAKTARLRIEASGAATLVYEEGSGQRVCELLGHPPGVTSWAVSADARWAATCCSTNSVVRLWDLPSGKLRQQFSQDDWVETLAFNPSSDRLVTGLRDGSARVWEIPLCTPTSEVMVHRTMVTSATFAPDGSRVLTTANDGTARFWSSTTGRPVSEWFHLPRVPLPTPGTYPLAYSPNGRWLSFPDGTVSVWDTLPGAAVPSIMMHDRPVRLVRFSPDGERLLTVTGDESFSGRTQDALRMWDTATGRLLWGPTTCNSSILDAAFTADSAFVLRATRTSSRGAPAATSISWLDASNGLTTAAMPPRPMAALSPSAFHPLGKAVIVSESYSEVTLRDLPASDKPCHRIHHDLGRFPPSWSADGRKILTALNPGTAGIWDVALATLVTSNTISHEVALTWAAFSPQGDRFVTASYDKTARVWDAVTGQPVSPPLQHLREVNVARFSPDGRLVVTASADGTARVWDALSGRPESDPMLHGESVLDASFDSRRRWILTASGDRTARVWDAASGQPVTEPLMHPSLVRSASFCADGRWVATVGADNVVRLWQMVSTDEAIPTWLPILAEALGGCRQDERGIIVTTSLDDYFDARKQALSSPANDAWSRWGEWFFADRAVRPPSPDSRTASSETSTSR